MYLQDHDDREALFYGSGGPLPLKERSDMDVYLELARAEEALARFSWSPYLHDPGLAHRLRRVTAPGLVVMGDEDSLVLNPDFFRKYAALVGGGAELRCVGGAGHRVEEERPAELADLLVKFVASSAPVAR
jgi:pimeloyl-ACP methyl ester carboxylesterase